MHENIISWNIPNWITVVLMAVLAFGILTGAAQLFHKARGAGKANA